MLSASLDDLKKGYKEEDDHYECLFCGKKTEKGVIYQQDDNFYDAHKQMKNHIEIKHGSVFESLIGMDKRYTGLSDHQKRLLELFYEGKNDLEVQKEMNIGSSSTIRNHRFLLKERERQAKVFLILMDILKSRDKKANGSDQSDSVSGTSENKVLQEEEDIIQKFFPFGPEGPLKTFQIKEKYKLVVLKQLAKRFSKDRVYTEKEVNGVLLNAYEDYATLRRYLIEYGFMQRKKDCSQYWLKDREEEEDMNRKKELIQQYKEMKKEGGVYQIRNIRNGKILILSTPDFKTMNGRRFELEMGSYRCTMLQKEWNDFGQEAFVFEILETLDEEEKGIFDKKDALKKLEEKWLKKLQPFGDKGYHKEGDLQL